MSNIKLNDILKDILAENAEEKTYEVTYYVEDKYGDDVDYNKTVKATSEEEAIKKVKDNASRLARKFDAKLKPIKEDFKRFDFQNTQGGGGRRFIPNQGIIPSSMFNDKDFMLSNDGTKLYMDPLLVNAIVNSKTLTNRAAQVRYQEFKEKMGPHFQQFKKGLEGRLSKVVKSGKPFEVWNGTVMTNKKGQVVFPYSDIGTIAENTFNPREYLIQKTGKAEAEKIEAQIKNGRGKYWSEDLWNMYINFKTPEEVFQMIKKYFTQN
jgi:hypothetical protein